MSIITDLQDRADALTEERNALKAEAETLTVDETRDAAAIDARADEIIARSAEIKADLDKLEARLADLNAIEVRQVNAKRAPVSGIHKPEDVRDVQALTNDEARGRARTFIEQSRNFAQDSHKENAVRLIDSSGQLGGAVARMALTTGTDTYATAWTKYMSGRSMFWTDAEKVAFQRGFDAYSAEERAGMTSGTGSSGGYLVPIFIDPTIIITGAGAANPLRSLAKVKTIGPAFGGWYGASAAQVTAAWTSETSAAPDNTPTITQVNIPVYMAEAFVPVSFQAFEDIADLAGDVVELFADAKNNLEAVAHQTNGTASIPKGVSYAVGAVTASRVSPTTAGTYGLVDMFAVHSALPARFWGPNPNRAWLMSMTVADKTRQLVQAQNSGNSVWTDVNGDVPPLLSGDKVAIGSAMSSTLTTGQDVLLYGDFSRYQIVDRIGFTTEFVPNLFDTSTGRPTAQRGWLAHWRTGADVTDVNAFRQLRL